MIASQPFSNYIILHLITGHQKIVGKHELPYNHFSRGGGGGGGGGGERFKMLRLIQDLQIDAFRAAG